MATNGSASATTWTYLKDMAAWIASPSIIMYGRWNHPPPSGNPNAPGEGGVDLTAPQGTPIYALATGTVIGAGYWTGNASDPSGKAHGVVTTRINVPGAGAQDLYYQHLTIDPSIKAGSIVQKGQQIGTVGAFGETEMGFNANWGTIWGTNHPGPWASDPRPMLKALMTDNSVSSAPTDSTTFNPLDPTTYFTSMVPTLKSWGEYIAIFLIASVLIVIGFVLLNEQAVGKAVKGVLS